MSALIVGNVVSGAVVSGYPAIGVIKSLGFTPGQVVTVYSGQVLVPALVGCLLGLLPGNALAVPLLGQAQRAYDVGGTGHLPVWVDVVVVLALLAVVALATVVPALRAGRFSAVQAISVGRAPRTGRGVRTAGGWPRPGCRARSASASERRSPGPPDPGTLLAVAIGAATVVFAAGLSSSLTRVTAALTRTGSVPVEVVFPDGPGPADSSAVRAVIEQQSGTAHVVGAAQTTVRMLGIDQDVQLTGYDGDVSWAGYVFVSGRWYSGPDEVVAGSRLLRATGHKVGDTVTLSSPEGSRTVRVVGEIFDRENDGFGLVGMSTGTAPDRFEVGLTRGTSAPSYVDVLTAGLRATPAIVMAREDGNETIEIMLALIGTLVILLATVAALGVFNTVVLNTREQVHEIGVLKSIGMTPRQVRVMVVASMTGIGLLAGLLAVPVGVLLHHQVIPVMGDAAGTAVPDSIRDVYRPGLLAALAGAGAVLAVLGALVPAGWASRTRPATALRAE